MNKYMVELNNLEDIPADGWAASFAETCIKKGMISYCDDLFNEIIKSDDLKASEKIALLKIIDKVLDKSFYSVRIIEIEDKKEEVKENEKER